MEALIKDINSKLSGFKDLTLLLLRLILAYGFFDPAMQKIQNFNDIVIWFGDGLNMPFPELNAFMATASEALGVVLLTLGLATRLISLPLMIVMLVAIVTVHGFSNFSCGDNGFEIPLYYMLMLFTLAAHGAGKFSLDETSFKKYFGSN